MCSRRRIPFFPTLRLHQVAACLRALRLAAISSVISASESQKLSKYARRVADYPRPSNELRQKHPSHREASHWRTNHAVSIENRVDLSHVGQWKLNITLVLHPRG